MKNKYIVRRLIRKAKMTNAKYTTERKGACVCVRAEERVQSIKWLNESKREKERKLRGMTSKVHNIE